MSSTNVTGSTSYLFYHSAGSFSNVRNDASCSDVVQTNVDIIWRNRRSTGTNYNFIRSTTLFDTSAISSTATVSAVTLYWYAEQEWTEQGTDYDTYVCPVSATGSAQSYYNIGYYGTYVGKILNTNDANRGSWKNGSLTISCITKAGTTILGFLGGKDYLNTNTFPLDDKQNQMGADWNVYKPYLTIVWTTPPVVTTGSVTLLTPVTATLGGNITDIGGGTVSTAGVCWGLTTNPTTSNSKTATATTFGAFTVSATSLIPGVLYHYRAYVTTENSTTYGADTTFRTPSGASIFFLV